MPHSDTVWRWRLPTTDTTHTENILQIVHHILCLTRSDDFVDRYNGFISDKENQCDASGEAKVNKD